MAEKEPEKNFEILTSFVSAFSPADENTYTDCYTTQEIIGLVSRLCGTVFSESECFQLMTEMKYTYHLIEGEYKWLFRL